MDPTITEELIARLQAMGSLGLALFAGVFILATLLLFPASPLAMLAGYLYGPLSGLLATSIAGLISAVLAFLISRYLAGARIKARSMHYPGCRPSIQSSLMTDFGWCSCSVWYRFCPSSLSVIYWE